MRVKIDLKHNRLILSLWSDCPWLLGKLTQNRGGCGARGFFWRKISHSLEPRTAERGFVRASKLARVI